MRQTLIASLVGAVFAAAPALADPGITVDYRDEQLRVTLNGSYAGTYFQAWRSADPAGAYQPFASQFTLCTGDCALTDLAAAPGATYWYRFDLQTPEGATTSYGPYPVVVPDTPLDVRAWPNPAFGPISIEISLPGSRRTDAPLSAEARIVDLQGRTVRTLRTGAMARGRTTLAWDGRGDAGQVLGAGVYFARIATPIGIASTRIVRFR